MEQLKVVKKDIIITNIIIHLILSFLFLYIQSAYQNQISPFSIVYFKKGLELFWYVAVLMLLTIKNVWSVKNISKLFYQLYIAVICFKILEGLFLEFNKVIVIAFFFFVTISYFLYQILNNYLNQASINPNFSKSDLFPPLLFVIRCKVMDSSTESEGFLTNWDEDGCFIKLSNPTDSTGFIRVTIFFQGREFCQEGEVVASTTDSCGLGVRFKKINKNLVVFNWAEFSEIADELGLGPSRLR